MFALIHLRIELYVHFNLRPNQAGNLIYLSCVNLILNLVKETLCHLKSLTSLSGF